MTKQNICKRLMTLLMVLLLMAIAAGCNEDKAEIEALRQEIEELKGNTPESSEIAVQQSSNETDQEVEYVYVAYPPSKNLLCQTCDNGNLKVACTYCDGTGKQELSSQPGDEKYASSPLWGAVTSVLEKCGMCNGTGTGRCYTCYGLGTVNNPEYKQYVASLLNLSRETGTNIFKVDPSTGDAGRYVTFENCFVCGGTGRDGEGFNCVGCNATGILVFTPDSIANPGGGLVKGNSLAQPANVSPGGGSSIGGGSSTTGGDRSSSSQYQRQCIKNGCNASAESGSQYCSIHKDSLSYNKYCAETGCYNPPASGSQYCGRHKP